MKTKDVSRIFSLLEAYEEKLKVIAKIQRAQESINKHYQAAHDIECSQDAYMRYLARLDYRINQLHKERQGNL